MSSSKVAVLMLLGYGAALAGGIAYFANEGGYQMIHLPLYGGDMIKPTMVAAVLSGLGACFALFGAWGIKRGAPRNGTMAIFMGAAPPLMVSAIVGAAAGLVTVVLAFRVAIVLERAAAERAQQHAA